MLVGKQNKYKENHPMSQTHYTQKKSEHLNQVWTKARLNKIKQRKANLTEIVQMFFAISAICPHLIF